MLFRTGYSSTELGDESGSHTVQSPGTRVAAAIKVLFTINADKRGDGLMTVRLQGFCVVLLSAITCLAVYADRPLGAAEPEKSAETVTPTSEMQQIARLTVANELMRLHWTTWVTGKELRTIASQAAKGINDQFEIRSEAEFLLPEVKAKPQKRSVFEKQAVEEIRAGVTELWRDAPDGKQYVRGIRATKSCLQCHQPLGTPGGELNEGDLLGIISIKLKR